MEKNGKVTRNVWVLGVVSLLNDVASEMVYPIVPIFLTSILGVPAFIVGLVEGIADAVAKLLMAISGIWSDRIHKRKLFVGIGYSFSTFSHLIMSLAYFWPMVLFARVINRTGKGIRTAARDAIITESTIKENRGVSFGIHRTMDDLGGVIGPILTIVLLAKLKNNYRLLFFLAFIPSLIGVLVVVFGIRDVVPTIKTKIFPRFEWNKTNASFRIFLFISFLFAVGNSSDVFLILRAQNLGLSVGLTIFTYVLFNITNSTFSLPAGIAADKIGFKRVLALGMVIFALVYFGFGYISTPDLVWILFPVYGVFMALTDGVGKAYISKLVPHEVSASAFGIYQTLMGVATLLASSIAGLLWTVLGPRTPFYFGATMAILAELVFFVLSKRIKLLERPG